MAMMAPGSPIRISCRLRWSVRPDDAGPNELAKKRDDVQVTQTDLLEVHQGKRTEEGLRETHPGRRAIYRGVAQGPGAVPIYNLMEDAATAEISRAQVWQWIYLKAKLDDGREVTPAMFCDALKGEMERVKGEVGAKRSTTAASKRRPSCSRTCRSATRSTNSSPCRLTS